MKLRFSKIPIDRLEVDILAIGCTAEERPLRGDAGLIDWRLKGFLSGVISDYKFKAHANERLLIPINGTLKAKWLLLIGLGNSLEVNNQTIADFSTQAIVSSSQLKANKVAILYPHVATTQPYCKESLEALLGGVSAAADKVGKAYRTELEITIPSHRDEAVDLTQIVYAKLLGRHKSPKSSTTLTF